MRRTTRALLLLPAASVLLGGLNAAHTARHEPTGDSFPPAPPVAVSDGAAERLAGSIRIRTVSAEDPTAFDASVFAALHAYLESAFPRVRARLRREKVASHSLLYTWPGSDPSLEPVLLAGHMDVVPVEPGTETDWQRDPFGGEIRDGYIWGRGSIDNKSAVLGTLEAVEMLLAEGFQPERTVYLAFGHDEEVGGMAGARAIAALLQSRGVELEMVLDEGGVIGEGLLSGIDGPVALVGIAEKGFVSVELATRIAGGHSSLPPRETAVGVLSAAVARLEERPMPARLEGPALQLFDRISPRLPWVQRTVFANLWLTRRLVLRRLEGSPTTNAMVRTTTAPTLFEAGTKDNVLPGSARAVLNFRILPGDSIASVVAHVKRAVADDRVQVRIVGRFTAEPSAVSDADSETYRALERTIRSTVPGAIVAPYLVVVATDARHYAGISRNVFRFLPLRLGSDDLGRMHGIDERVAVREYEAAVRTYRQLLVETAGPVS